MKSITPPDLRIGNLEYLFTPPGLPLVDKSDEAPPTTSILIRGGAGSGKTTFAVALGHAIACAGGGVALYLTTELSQAELAYKAKLLALPKGAVVPGGEQGRAPVGGIVTEHLSLRYSEPEAVNNAVRKARALEVAWEILHPSSGGAFPLPVRAVVVDAFPLVDSGADEPTLRSDLVAFIQGLEGEGISTVIVEESIQGGTSWLPFVVDVAFDLDWSTEPGTGDLHRKLRCTKSRYAQALAGPHDYGLVNGVPAVWPDVLRVAAAHTGDMALHVKRPAAVFVPFSSEPKYVRLKQGGLILSSHEAGPRRLDLVTRTPGVVPVEVRCGPLTVIRGAMLPQPVQVPDVEGPEALGWVILRLVQEHGVNTVVVHDPEALLRRPRFEIPMLHLLEGLRQLGVLVLVHARSPRGDLVSTADLHGDKSIAREIIPMPPDELRWGVMWVTGPATTRADVSKEIRTLRSQLDLARTQMEASNLAGAKETLLAVEANPATPTGRILAIESGVALHQLGLTYAGRGRIQNARDRSHLQVEAAAAWAMALAGDEWSASNIVLDALPSGANLSLDLLWSGLCALHAGNASAIDALQASDEPRLIGFLLRALAVWRGSADVSAAAARLEQASLGPEWLVQRMQSEAMLFSPSEPERSAAVARLESLEGDKQTSLVHRADLAHNLGVICERKGKRVEAAKWYEKALSLNPWLDLARAGLTRLEVPVLPPPDN